MRHSITPETLDVAFDQESLIANAGILPAVLLTRRMQVGELIDERLGLSDKFANANRGDKLLTLTYSSLLGGEWISDVSVLGAGETSRILGIRAKAPSTVGTFLRSFGWANVRQLDAVSRIALKRAWALGAGPGDGSLTIDVDSTLCETYGSQKHGARELTYTGQKGYHPLLATVGGSGQVLHARLRGGRSNAGRGGADFVAEAISRARYAGANGPITVRADSGFHNYAFAAACRRRGARFSVTARNMHGSIARRIAEIPEEDWLPVEDMEYAEAAEIPHVLIPPQAQRGKKNPIPVRLIVRRVRERPLPLFPDLGPIYRHHAHLTDREGGLLELERDHRQHAQVANPR